MEVAMENSTKQNSKEELKKNVEAEIRIPDTFLKEIRVSEKVVEIVISDDSVAIGDFDWYVVNKKSDILTGLADVVEEHETYYLLGYRK